MGFTLLPLRLLRKHNSTDPLTLQVALLDDLEIRLL